MRGRHSGRLEYPAGCYAIFLASYLEAFSVSPEELSWLDLEIYQLYLAARAEHGKEAAKNAGKRLKM